MESRGSVLIIRGLFLTTKNEANIAVRLALFLHDKLGLAAEELAEESAAADGA